MSSDPNTLFRGNSLASKVIDEYMKLVGQSYLQETVQCCIDEVSDRTANVDLKRLILCRYLMSVVSVKLIHHGLGKLTTEMSTWLVWRRDEALSFSHKLHHRQISCSLWRKF